MNRFVFPLILALAATAQAATYHVAPQPLGSVPAELQFRTIGEAAKRVNAGDRVILHTGVYREGVTIEASGTAEKPIHFEAAPGASVVVTGADVISNWRLEPGGDGDHVFSTEWPYKFITYSPKMAHPDDDEHVLIGRAEQVFVGGYPLRQVLSRDKVTRGTFFADTDNQRLYLQTATNADNLNEARVEASTRSTIWETKGAWVQTRGIRFRYAANAAQQGMAIFGGAHDSVLDCVFEDSNASGAAFVAPDIEVQRCTFQDNGQLGWGAAYAHRLHFTGCLVQNNNVKNFSRGWEAGGDKIVLSLDVLLEDSRFLRNRGSGIWFDIGNESPEVRHCLVADNEDCGLAYEISYGLHAHDNIFAGNGLADSPGAWGFSGGIAVSSSPGCTIERNLFIGNKEGFQFREQGRTTPRIDAPQGAKEEWIWNHDETVKNNTFAFNRDAAVWGWFDVRDERLWPRALRKFNGRERPDYQPEADFARDYQSNLDRGAPQDLSLEKLNIRFANNLYAPGDSGGIFHWGTGWLRHEYFDGPDAMQKVRARLGFEQSSVVAPFVFMDYLTHDFRVPSGSKALTLKAYPQGNIPGALTGLIPATDKLTSKGNQPGTKQDKAAKVK